MDEDEAIILLNKYASDEEAFEKIIAHAQAVKEVALKITQEILEQGFFVDIDLVQSGALLHDIGRFEYPPGSDKMYRHGLVGSDILRKEGHPQEALIAERHLGPGISREEILEQDLDLPHQDFIPESYEEKIVCYADKLISGVKEITIKESKKRFKKEIGEKCEARLQALHEEISELRGL